MAYGWVPRMGQKWSKAEYVSRKVMDRYMDGLTIRLERMYTRIQRIEARMVVLESKSAQVISALGPSEEDD